MRGKGCLGTFFWCSDLEQAQSQGEMRLKQVEYTPLEGGLGGFLILLSSALELHL